MEKPSLQMAALVGALTLTPTANAQNNHAADSFELPDCIMQQHSENTNGITVSTHFKDTNSLEVGVTITDGITENEAIELLSNINDPLSKKAVLAMQAALKLMGYNPGTIDALWGRNTAAALKKFQCTLPFMESPSDGKRSKKAIEHLLKALKAFSSQDLNTNPFGSSTEPSIWGPGNIIEAQF